MRGAVALAAAAALPGVAFAEASSSTCLVVDNARAHGPAVTVEIDGYSGFWVMQPNQTYTLFSSGQIVRGSSFTLHVYDGDENQGTKGALYDTVHAEFTGTSYGTSTHTLLTLVTPPTSDDARANPDCRQTGYWLALIHD
ncbi:MAG: hypothetical protein GC190_11910 [Alphaproteobacteria bacterium]|nr:hypothetical protein [Alphaproteobacteria bacterium]